MFVNPNIPRKDTPKISVAVPTAVFDMFVFNDHLGPIAKFIICPKFVKKPFVFP